MVSQFVTIAEAVATWWIKGSALELQTVNRHLLRAATHTHLDDRVRRVGADLLMLGVPRRRKTILGPIIGVFLYLVSAVSIAEVERLTQSNPTGYPSCPCHS